MPATSMNRNTSKTGSDVGINDDILDGYYFRYYFAFSSWGPLNAKDDQFEVLLVEDRE